MDGVLNSVSQMLGNVTKLLDNLNTAVNDMGVVFDGIQTTVSDTTESLEQIQTVIDNVSTKLTELINRLESAEDDEKVDALLKFLQGDPEVTAPSLQNRYR